MFKPEQYNIHADGRMNASKLVQEMFNTIPDGCTLYFSEGRYVMDASDEIFIRKNIEIKMSSNSSIELVNQKDNIAFLNIVGKVPDRFQTTEKIDKYSCKISIPKEITLTIGDLLFITTSQAYGGNGEEFDGAQGNTKGEIIEVSYVKDGFVYTVSKIKDSYPVKSIIAKIDYKIVKIDGLKIKSNSASKMRLLNIAFTKNLTIKDCEFSESGHTAVQINGAYKFSISNIRGHNLIYKDTECCGNDYGLVISGCQDGTITECKISGGRHAIDITGGDNGSRWPSRNIIVSNNILQDQPTIQQPAMSTHPACENIIISNNIINGSVTIRNINTIFKNNKVSGSVGFQWMGKCDYQVIEGNHIDRSMDANLVPLTVHLISLDKYTTNSLSITGNTIKANAATIRLSGESERLGTHSINHVNISNNNIYQIQSDGSSGNNYTCYLMHFQAHKYDIKQLSINNNNTFVDAVGKADNRIYFEAGKAKKINIKNNSFDENFIFYNESFEK